jgi:hypothetical protein
MSGDPVAVARLMARIFDEAGIPYLVGGSVASTVHGEARTTADVDFAIRLDPAGVPDLIGRMQDAFFLQAALVNSAVEHCAAFNAIHRDSMIKVDVYVRPAEGLYASEMERAERIRLGGDDTEPVRVATAEDTMLQKLRWYRSGGDSSERQWRDVLGVAKTRGAALDLAYLQSWAARLDLEDLLERVLLESGLSR